MLFLNIHHVLFAGYLKGQVVVDFVVVMWGATGQKVTYLLYVACNFFVALEGTYIIIPIIITS